MATIRKRGNKYQVMIRKKNVNNSKTFQRMSDAKRWAEETELSIERNEAGLPHSSKDSLFRDLIKSYKSRAIRSNRGLGKSKENILKRLDDFFGRLPAQLKQHQIQEFCDERIKHKVKPATLKMDVNYIGAILKHARDYQELNIDLRPIERVKSHLESDGHIGTADKRERRPSDEELSLLREHFEQKQDLSMDMNIIIDFAVSTGMRLGEICRIEWKDFDEKNQTITIRRRKNPSQPKDHTIPLVKNRGINPIGLINKSTALKSFGGKIFPYTEAAVSANFRKACKKLNINDLRFHDLRHEAISSLFELGFNVQHVMAISGHSDLAQLSRYTNTTPAEVLALASNLKS